MTYITCTNIVDGSADDYAAVSANLSTTEPDGLISRFAGMADGTFVVVAAWTSKAAWDRFAAEQLGPAVRAADPRHGSATTLEFDATDVFIADTTRAT
ncbi:MAG: hypothetical protein AB7L17_14760 [Ilumatobacteraceae bacterium]